jgi:hypothetical protein
MAFPFDNFGLFDNLFKDPEIKTTSTGTPEQQQLMSLLGQYLQSKLGTGLPTYTGQQTAGLSDLQTQGISKISDALNAGQTPLVQQGLGAYSELLKGMSPQESANYYEQYYAPAENAYLKNTLIPTFKESMVPGGTLRSTGTERGIGDIVTNFGNQQMSRLGDFIQTDKNRAANALGQLGSMSELESGMSTAKSAIEAGDLQRQVEQADLTAKFEEFKRTTPELNPLMDKLMGYLGLSTNAAYTSSDPLLSLLASIIQSGGQAVGAAMAGGA